MQILIEGADGVGKSTLCEALLKAMPGYKYVHFGIPDSHPIDYWFKEGLGEIKGGMVIDRLHLSEEAYGPVFREGSKLTEHQFWLLEGWLWARNTILVICSTSWDNMKANQAKIKHDYHKEVQQHKIVDNFQQLLFKTSLPLCIYDYTVHNNVLPEVQKAFSPLTNETVGRTLVDLLSNRDKFVDFEDEGIGCVCPTVWLVGDQPNPNYDAPVTNLFQPAFQSTSGEYLRKALNHVYGWDSMHISNARDVEGEVYDLDGKWRQLGQPQVVALGNNAAKALDKAMVPYCKVPHPQWWRRFQNSQVEEYGDAIKFAARR